MKKVLTIVIGLAAFLALGASSCDTTSPTVNTSGSSTSASSSSNTASSSSKPASAAHVGATISLPGESVMVVKVIDPAQGADQFTTPDAGKRFVGVEVTINDTGKAALSDDANSTLSVIGSDSQDYSADFSSISECTNFNNGSYNIASGQSQTGCVTFQIPNAVTVAKVQFTDNAGMGSNTAQWLVP